jgi:D-alanyl-D-alanine carboxypeptidase
VAGQSVVRRAYRAVEFEWPAARSGGQGVFGVGLSRARWGVDRKVDERVEDGKGGGGARRADWRLGVVLALALGASACGSVAGMVPAPGALGEAATEGAGRVAIQLAPPAIAVETAGGAGLAAGSTADGLLGQGAQGAGTVAPDEPSAAAGAATPSGQGAALASLAGSGPSDPVGLAAGAARATDRMEDHSAVLAPAPVVAGPRRVSAAAPPAVTARYVAVLDDASGELLYGEDERARVAPASVTKIATTLVALERAPDLGQRVPVTISGSAMAARDRSSIMGLEPGREVALGTLLYGMMLPSGNDAAEQVALALGESRETYVAWMNEKVAALGLTDTHFVNPSGMDAADHYSSAYDMARLGRIAMQDETFRRLAGAASYRGDGYSMNNLNRLIGAYPGADGIKIGLTRAAGRTIVASATRDGHRVFVSLMRSQDLPADSTALFEWVWRTFEW